VDEQPGEHTGLVGGDPTGDAEEHPAPRERVT
jgi:hypothetical protein